MAANKHTTNKHNAKLQRQFLSENRWLDKWTSTRLHHLM